jgi:hypothetical protein
MNNESQSLAKQSAKPSILDRGIRWLKKPGAERSRLFVNKMKRISALPFHFGRANFWTVHLAYQPDSQSFNQSHPEFYSLFDRFTAHNQLNNAGDATRLWFFILNLKQIITEKIEGDFAELGVWRGNTASVLAHFAAESGRELFLFDTFEGFDSRDIDGIDANKRMAFDNTSIDMVKTVIGENSKVCNFTKGRFPDTITEKHNERRYAAVSLDCDLYEPMKAGLEFFYPRMPQGALFLLHDYSSHLWDGSTKAIDEFCRKTQENVILMPDKSGSALIRKSH